MKKLNQILQNSSNSAILQMNHIYKIWYSVIMDNLKTVTTPYNFDPYTKTLTIKVHDNIWFTDLSYMTEDFKIKLNEKGLDVLKVVFKYSPKYEKIKQNNQTTYKLSDKCKNYIENSVKKINNKKIAEDFEKYLVNYFQHNNFESWIIK